MEHVPEAQGWTLAHFVAEPWALNTHTYVLIFTDASDAALLVVLIV